MFLADCIWVWIFSTTSPSWMMSCVTLMPVISMKAFVSVFDSYSCVVMVSETTLMPTLLSHARGRGSSRAPPFALRILLRRVLHVAFEFRGLRGREAQAELAAAPQHVLGARGPFLAHQ